MLADDLVAGADSVGEIFIVEQGQPFEIEQKITILLGSGEQGVHQFHSRLKLPVLKRSSDIPDFCCFSPAADSRQ